MYNSSMSGRYGITCCLIFTTLFWHLSACVAQELSPPQEAVFQPRYDQALDKGSRGSYPVREFYSTKTKIPNVNFLKWTPECATRNDFYFITPKGWKVRNPGPMILDHRGDLVWFEHFGNEFGGNAYDLMVQEYLGEKFLTFWLGDDRVRGHGAGHFHMINPAYDTIHQIGAGNNRSADLHEFRLTPQGTALIIVFESIPFDVRPAGRVYGGLWDQYMWDCLIQEVDIKTKDVIFEWRASDHIDIKDSYNTIVDRSEGTPGNPYDAFHFNSVDKDDLGNYLVSARYTHAIYYISGTTNQIIWTLGGKNNTFMDISPVSPLNFAWQHDARFVDVNAFPETYVPPPAKEGSTTRLLSLFDNAAEDWNYNQGPANARGLLLEITYPTTPPAEPHAPKPVRDRDEIKRMLKESQKSTTMSGIDAYKVADINGTDPAYTVRLVQQYADPQTWRASSQGSMQLVPTETGKDPHVLLGHGINAVIAEYSGNGTLLCDMHFGAQSGWEKGDVQSYRALKFSDWVGRPHVPPDIAVVGHHAYVSWNGATGVDEWLLQTWEGGEGDHWVAAGLTKKTGFETKLEIPSDRRKSKFLRVTAIDANGQACEHGVSDALERGYIYGRKRRSGRLTWRQTLLYSVAGFVGFVVSIRLLRRCYARYQRRRGAKWRLT